jgi:hypothetical protein
MPSVQIGSQREVFEECSMDIRASIEFLKARGYGEFVLEGHSYGCNKVVWYAVNDGFPGRLVLLAPCDIVELDAKFKPNDTRIGANFDMFRYRNATVNEKVAGIGNAVLGEIGTADEYIVQADKRVCVEALGRTFRNFVGKLVDGANHNFDGKYSEAAENIIGWLNRNKSV